MTWAFEGLERGAYAVALLDPPWKFSAGTKSRPQHYRRMTFEEVAALPVRDLLDPAGARVMLWITAPLMSRAIELQKAWGLRYCSMIPWIKLWPSETGMFVYRSSIARGTGYEVQGNAEYLLIYKRGKPQSIRGNPFPGVFMSERREHSRKPEESYQAIESRISGRLADVFSRQRRNRWENFGDQAEKFEAAE